MGLRDKGLFYIRKVWTVKYVKIRFHTRSRIKQTKQREVEGRLKVDITILYGGGNDGYTTRKTSW